MWTNFVKRLIWCQDEDDSDDDNDDDDDEDEQVGVDEDEAPNVEWNFFILSFLFTFKNEDIGLSKSNLSFFIRTTNKYSEH